MLDVSVVEVFSFLFTGINACFDWLQTYILVGDWGLIIFGIIFFCVFARLILAPLFGVSISAGLSDTVKRVQNEIKVDSTERMGENMSPNDERWLM